MIYVLNQLTIGTKQLANNKGREKQPDNDIQNQTDNQWMWNVLLSGLAGLMKELDDRYR